MSSMLITARFFVFYMGLAFAVWSDCQCRKIPNRLSVIMATAGIVLALFGGTPMIKQAGVGLLCGLGLGIALWLLCVVRAGDAKLMAAIGVLMGGRWLLNVFTWALLVGMLLGGVILLYKHELGSRLGRLWNYGKSLIYSQHFSAYKPEKGSEGELPFAVPLFIGAVLTAWYRLW